MDILKKQLFLLLLPVLLSGCYEDFDPRIDTKPVLCLNSLITAGEPIDVKVSRTWIYSDPTGETNHSVKDATVKIFANGNPVDKEYIPEEGDRIRILASSLTYGEAEAEVTVPIATRISDVEYTAKLKDLWTLDTPGWGLNADLTFDIRVSMDLNDNGATEDYHLLTYDIFNSNKGSIWADEDDDISSASTDNAYYAALSGGNFDALDPVFYQQVDPFEDIMFGSYSCLYFSDRTYNGEVKPLEFGFSKCNFRLSGWKGDSDYLDSGWEITFYSISESYYNWIAYCDQSGGAIFGDMGSFGLAEPIWGYSNVSTGAGVVAARSSTTISINIKEFLLKTLDDSIP